MSSSSLPPEADRPSSAVSHWSLATALFLAIAALLFIRQLAPDRVLLPVDALFLVPPYAEAAERLGVTYPENPLVADTILQNYGWKQFAASQWLAGQAPLWNPYILTGQPFLAAAQNASLYPPGVLFYVLPLGDAYEWFAVLHFTLAGLFTAMFLAALGVGWTGRLIAGLAFELCGFLVVSVVWPMMVSTAVWLPLILCVVERVLSTPAWRPRARWLVLGGAAVALQFLAGHLEISFYLLATSGAYATLRLAPSIARRFAPSLGLGLTLLGMVAAGALAAAVQIVPFAEAIDQNVRVGQVTFNDVQSYALDRGQWWTFVLPDFFGNPTHRTLLDARDGAIHSVEHVRARDDSQQLRRDTEWGKRNYVEGASYLGVSALVLAIVGAIARPRKGWPLLAIGLASLCFAFGTPLYALVYYGLPGGNQVHTPFRWIYPWSMCLAALAGLGADALVRSPGVMARRASAAVAWTCMILGLLAVAGAAFLWLAAQRGDTALQPLISRWPEIRDGFSDGAAFASYTTPQVLGLALLLLATGAVILAALRLPGRATGLLLGCLVAADLWTFGVGFNPAARRDLLDFEPPALAFMRAQPRPFRIAALGPEDVFPANLAMRAQLEDIRGYDTIIRREYVDYLNLIERPGALLYSKVEKLFDPGSLTSPLFHALNVGYVLSARPVDQPGYELAFSEGVNVYRVTRALTRAFMVADARVVGTPDEAIEALKRIDPARTVVLESPPPPGQPATDSGPLSDAHVQEIRHQPQEVVLRASSGRGGYLVLMDAYDPGWIAQLDGQNTPVLRANRAFRAVAVPPGEHDVRMLYRPLSFRIGLLLSGIGGLLLCALALAAWWPRQRAANEEHAMLGTIVRNISAPFAANLVSRVLDLGLALVMFRSLGPSGVGAYTFAVVLTGYLDILAGFGLTTLVTRDAARHPERLAWYFGNSLLARAGFWVVAALAAWIVVVPFGGTLSVGPELSLAVCLLVLGLLPSGYSAALSALLQSRERFDIPAAVTLVSAVLKILLGVSALLAGWGFVGLAAVSIVTNLITGALLTALAIRTIRLPRPSIDPALARRMIIAAFPLMLSQVLNALFFRMDALLLKPLAGDEALGWYSTAYRFIDAFQIIPSTVILALFPLISRQADDRLAVRRSASLTLRALLSLAFPIAVGCTVLAEPIILAFAGRGYVPQSVIALQILIWYLPLSFLNGLAQYVLIARGRQRILTLAFALGVMFNVTANLVLIPRLGYQAAAWITLASELVLLIPFWVAMRVERVTPDLLGTTWRPVAAALAMGAAILPLAPFNPLLAAIVGAVLYAVALIAVRGVTLGELRLLRRSL